MRVISPKFLGRLITCSSCGALLQWDDNDVYDGVVYCSICKQPTPVDYDKKYDGIIKEESMPNGDGN